MGGLKALLQPANFTLGPDATLYTETHKNSARTKASTQPTRQSKNIKSKLQYTLNGSNTDGSFTVDDSNSFFSPYEILTIAQENKYLGMFFLFYHGIVSRVYSIESPHRGDSNEYTQHAIIV